MRGRGRIAVVSPREERRNSARAWAPLLRDRADLRFCEGTDDVADEEVVVVDETCPDLEGWFERSSQAGRRPESVVVFGAPEHAPGVLPWGTDGEEVLAVISELLDRRDLLGESDELLDGLRASGDRLAEHRRRLADLVLEAHDPTHPGRTSLAEEVDRLTRLAGVARFLAAPGPDEGYADRLAEAVGRALRASGLALLRRVDDVWRLDGRWRLSARAARALVPGAGDADRLQIGVALAARAGRGFWLPLGTSPVATALVGLARPGRDPSTLLGSEGLAELRALVADALTARDATTALLHRKAQSERVVQTLRSGLLKVDASERVLLVNPALAAMLETGAERLEGRPLADALARDPHVVEILRRAIVESAALDDVETYVTSTGGRRVAVSLRASPLGEEGGPTEGVLVLLSDLARRKELEEEVRKADRLAALGRLSAGVAHEIRNPLAGIRTTAEILRGRIGSDVDLGRFVDVILEEAERLDRIVGSLLQFAKPSAPHRAPVRLADLLERASRLAAGRAADRGVSLRVAAARDLPEPVADRDQVLQVILNLILNGIDATPPGGEVTVRCEADRDELRFVVEDGGEGVPPSLRERVFDPFFTTKPGGTGLGLSISQNIVRAHGGRLRLERPEGGRSRAVATLPLRLPASNAYPGGATWRTS
ncbi:MAG: ATP-binding protein [bacterium]